jgi:LPXTG-site transpeptidase (sortase) family protein
MRSTVARATVSAARESELQVAWSIRDVGTWLHDLQRDVSATLERTLSFLLQPVWIPRKRGPPKQRSRAALFMGDVVRFGATFATIFGVLFVGLNYQSFSSIIAAQIDPLSAAEDAGKLSRMLAVDAPDADVAVARAGDLFSLVPPVGPPENRLVIPKLNLNIPIVIPSNTALIDENWTALEKDIQDGLQHGVVHYPGTARPGQAGNVFITGYSSYYYPGPYTSVFARLAELDPGDEFWLYYGGDKHRYRIIDEREVSPTDVSVLNQPSTIREATLMTCTPVGTTLRRLVVRAQEIDVITGEVLAVGEHGQQPDLPEMKMEMLPI